MTQQMVISVDTSGRVESMHFDNFNLAFLGKREIKRASDITFDPNSGTWDIFMNDGTGAFTKTAPDISGFSDYEEARRFEVKWLNECRLRGVVATSYYGLYVLAAHLRNDMALLTYSPAV